MRFRDVAQQSRVCAALLELMGRGKEWDLENHCPSQGLASLMESHRLAGPSLAELGVDQAAEEMLTRVVFDFWNGTGRARLHDITTYLPHDVVLAIGTLLQCHGSPLAIDTWLARRR